MFQSRWYQNEAELSIFNYFKKGNVGNPVVAMPTGTGKSIVIANFIRKVFEQWPTQRVMMLTHVKELIQQNAEKLISVWPTAPLGIYSAGLNSRDMILPVVFGGVQSVSKAIKKSVESNTPHFGYRDLVIIDECHLLGPNEDTMYQYIISELLKINPYLKVVGLTATPYRLKQGMITDEGGIFTDVCYDLTKMQNFNRLIDEGFLAPLIPKRTATEVDVSEVGMARGDFNSKQLQNAVDKDEITYNAVKEICEQGYGRKSWLIFASGVENSEHIAAMFQSFGVSAAACHSKLKSVENDRIIAAFKSGEIKALVNNNKLTTGFDHPPIDLIGMLRPTLSPGLWVQMLGRGTRPCEGKENCLVLDFAGNTRRLGPINDPVKPKKPGKGGGGGDAPIRICDMCGMYNHASVRVCDNCGYEFPRQSKLSVTASEDVLIKSDSPQVEYFEVQKVIYNLHEKKNKEGVATSPPSIKVSYFCGLLMFNEWVCLEHSGFAAKKARDWWKQRHNEDPPATTHRALEKVSGLSVPAKIRVWVNKKHPEILSCEW